MSTSKYKGKDIFVTTAGSEYVSMGGRDAEMTFGIGKIAYSNLYLHSYLEYAAESDAGKLSALDPIKTALNTNSGDFNANTLVGNSDNITKFNVRNVIDTRNIVDGHKYFSNVVSDTTPASDFDDFGGTASATAVPSANDGTTGTAFTSTARGTLTAGESVAKQEGQLLFAASEGLLESTPDTNMLTSQIEDVQAKINTARVQAGSQYAAIESAVSYTTDLTAQYELGFNTVSDVNFSMETAHLAKNQILQQAATAMLAQANQGQQGLLQLIQG
jgi:flagellin-like hook-associated protein FlgL